MELRQMRYFVRVVELGSMGRAAIDLSVVTSTLSQQIGRLEGELATRLLTRTSAGVRPTDAGLAFFRQAQLALRHADGAIREAQQSRLSGEVRVGLAPSTAAMLALPFVAAMRARYPDVRLHLVETLSGALAAMLNARQLDVAILFDGAAARRWSVRPLLDERLYLIGVPGLASMPTGKQVRLSKLGALPLILPSGAHGLRAIIDDAFRRVHRMPLIALEIDGLAVLMDAVRAGFGATIQPAAAMVRLPLDELAMIEVKDPAAYRRNLLSSVSEEELAPAGLAARNVLVDTVRELVTRDLWAGTRLHET